MTKRLVLAIAFAAATQVVPAIAADLDVKAPVYAPPVPAVYSWWTGCYFGGHLGFAFSKLNYTHDNGLGVVETFNFTPNAFVGGLQVGCNYQWNNLVFGVEGTWSGTGLRQAAPSAILGTNFGREIKVNGLATFTGRFGYAWDRTMLYGKAGWAGAQVDARAFNFATGAAAEFNQWNSGWTVGAGVEHVPWANIIVGMEFDYYNVSFSNSGVDSLGGISRFTAGNANVYAFTMRLSYLFGPPVTTNYAP